MKRREDRISMSTITMQKMRQIYRIFSKDTR
jgi:hypothetical protein